jgi:hypothetical protein
VGGGLASVRMSSESVWTNWLMSMARWNGGRARDRRTTADVAGSHHGSVAVSPWLDR